MVEGDGSESRRAGRKKQSRRGLTKTTLDRVEGRDKRVSSLPGKGRLSDPGFGNPHRDNQDRPGPVFSSHWQREIV
jgi:hypothetical protein